VLPNYSLVTEKLSDMDFFSWPVTIFYNNWASLKETGAYRTIQMGGKRIGHYVKLAAFSVVISANISLALILVDLFYL